MREVISSHYFSILWIGTKFRTEHLPSTALKTRLFGDWKTAKKQKIGFDETPYQQGFQPIMKFELIIRK